MFAGAVGSVLLERVSAYGNTSGLGTAIFLPDVADSCVLSALDVHHNTTVRGPIPPGGALDIEQADCTIADSLFEDNVAESYGGGLVLISGTTSLENTLIRANHAQEGGGIHVLAYEADTTVVADADTLIENNDASIRGGGVVAYPYGDYTITLRGLTARRNMALEGGGLAIEQDPGATVVVDGGTFSDNVALALGGGGLAARGGTLRLQGGAAFIANGAPETRKSDGGWGGGVLVQAAAVEMDGVVFDRNSAISGGGLFLWGPTSCTLANLHVVRNVAGGIALVSDPGKAGRSRCTLSDALVELNLSHAWGGGIGVIGAMLELERVMIRDNESNHGGGLNLYDLEGKGTILMGDGGSIISGNTGWVMGGGIVVWPSFGMPLRIEGVIVSDNEGDRGGGIAVPMVFEGVCSDVALDGVVLSNNTAQKGGGLWLACPTTLTGSRVVANHAMFGGGAFLGLGTLASNGSAWGEGKLENDPQDVLVGDAAYSFGGAAADFVCSAATATCD